MKILIPFVFGIVFGVLTGCANYNAAADALMNKACGVEGQAGRDAYRAARGPEYRAKDRAACIRCPGEKALKCTGDPMALPDAS